MRYVKISMALLELLISIGMIITAMAALNEDWTAEIQTTVNYNLSDNVKPTHYNIQLILPIEEDVYSGESMISIKIYKETRHIELHSANLIVTTVALINKNLQIFKKNTEESVYKPMIYFYYHQTNIFSMYFRDEILPGNYTLSMRFLGKATKNTEGLFRTSYKNRKGNTMWLFATYLQTTGARYLFPCWDEPKLKAEFTISVKHPKKYKALSNMPIQNVHNVENGMVWTYFNTTPSISSYLIAIAITDFTDDVSLNNDVINNIVFDESNIKVWFREKMHYSSTAYSIFQYFAKFMNNFWRMYTFKLIPKVDYVAIPDFPEKAVATLGLVFYREADIFYEPDSIMCELNIESLIAYNMLVESLSGLPSWLKEGFAIFFDADIHDKHFSSHNKMNFFVVQKQHESLRFNFHLNKNLLQINKLDINLFPGFLRYNKAFSILRMLHHLVTDLVFPLGMKIYLEKNSGSILSSKIFWRSMQDALDELHPENNVILIRKMDGWTKQKSYPILKLTRINGYTNISLENSDSIDGELWIPMTYTTQNNPDFSKTSFRDVEWLKFTKEESFSNDVSKVFKEDGWIIINLRQAGYYRVNYDTENWKKIAKYLNNMKYTDIHVLNRAQIIDDAYHFLMTGQINSSLFWEITNYLSRETNFIAWYPMIKAFEYMSSVFPLSNLRAYDLKEKMQKILNRFLQKNPYEKLNMLMYIAQEIRTWTCILGDFDCKKLATYYLQQNLSNRTRNKEYRFLPTEEWTYCNGLAMSNNILWTNVLDIYQEEFDNKYLRFLACSENIAIIQKFIMLVAVENCNKTIKHKDCMSSLHFIIAKHAKNIIILDYIFANFNKIIPRQATVAILIDIINHVYSTEQFDKIRQFVKDYSKELILNVERKIEIRLSEIKNQMDYLEILTK